MTRHIFVSVRPRKPIPEVGDLVRSRGQTGHANIVLGVSPVHKSVDGNFVYVRSVRYGKINFGNFQLLKGQRSRSFRYYIEEDSRSWYFMRAWEVVEEFVKLDTAALRASIVKSMEGVDTTYKAPMHEDDEDGEYEGDDDGDD